MAMTYVASVCPNYVSGTDTSMATDATGGGTLNVAAHDILVVWYSWEDGTGGTLGCGDGGTNTFTLSSELGTDWEKLRGARLLPRLCRERDGGDHGDQ